LLFHQLAILPHWHYVVLSKWYANLPFYKMALHQIAILPKSIMATYHFTKKYYAKLLLCQKGIMLFCQNGVMTTCSIAKISLYQLAIFPNDIMPTYHFAKKYYAKLLLCQNDIMPTCNFANLQFCHIGIMPHWHYVVSSK
jgi:hypothetical protein